MPRIEHSGMGLPTFEQFHLNLFFRIGSAVQSDVSVLSSFERSSRDILKVVDANDIGVLSQDFRIPRLQGLRGSSCNWSVLMVLEHLTTVNNTIRETIRSLRSDSQPFEKIDILKFEPDEDAGSDVIDRFRDSCQRYCSFAKSHRPLRSSLTHAHPWFGELDGHAWHYFVATHQKIHRRQIYKILAMIGVV